MSMTMATIAVNTPVAEAVLLLDAPESRLVDMDVRASHEPSPPCGQ